MGIIASHIVSKEIQQGMIIGIKTSKSEIRNQISLTQLQDKIPTLTEKIFIKFLLKEIELIGLQIEGKRSGLEGDVLDGDTNINQKGEHMDGGTICV